MGVGSLQLLLDRGEQVGWSDADEIWIEAIVAIAGFYYFFALVDDQRAVRAVRNVQGSQLRLRVMFMVVIGVVLFGTMALVTPFMQKCARLSDQTGFLLGRAGSARCSP